MRAAATIALGVVVASSCSSGGIEPLELVEIDDRTVQLLTVCTDEDVPTGVSEVVETDGELIIGEVSDGRVRRGDDCQGLVTIELDRPLGDRAVTVDGERWPRIDDDCERARFASPDWIEQLDWNLPLPCDDRG